MAYLGAMLEKCSCFPFAWQTTALHPPMVVALLRAAFRVLRRFVWSCCVSLSGVIDAQDWLGRARCHGKMEEPLIFHGAMSEPWTWSAAVACMCDDIDLRLPDCPLNDLSGTQHFVCDTVLPAVCMPVESAGWTVASVARAAVVIHDCQAWAQLSPKFPPGLLRPFPPITRVVRH